MRDACAGDAASSPGPDSFARDGVVPWESRRRRLEANLAVLKKRWPDVAALISTTWRAASSRYELVPDAAGRVNVRTRAADGTSPWLVGHADHAALAARDVKLRVEGALPPAVLFDGVGLGWHLMEAYRQTHQTFLGACGAIYVVERDIETLAVALHLHDWREVFADPRVCLFAGAGADERFETFLQTDAHWPAPLVVCRTPGRLNQNAIQRDRAHGAVQSALCSGAEPRTTRNISQGAQPPVAERAARVAQQRAALADRLRAQIAERYAGRDAGWWAGRFGRGGTSASPLRVLCLTSRHTTFLQYSMRDCIAALEALGCETRLLIEPTPYQALDATVVLRAQLDFQPDLILLLSRMRYEMPDRLHPAIPSITWDQDALPWVFREELRGRFGPNDFLFGVKAIDATHIFGWPAARCRYAELATSERTYSHEPLPAADLAPYRCDVSFVSHASRPPEEEHPHVLAWLQHEPLRAVYSAVAERMLPVWRGDGAFPGPLHSEIYDAFERLRGRWPEADEFAAVHQAAMRLADRVLRHTALEWVADWAERTGRRFHLYGNGWEKHPRLAAFARGRADNGEELRRIYQASAINLQLMGWGFLHQRALDGLCAGGFFLSRRSLWDDWMPRLRALDARLASAGVATLEDFERLGAGAARDDIRAALAAVGADPRWLANPYCAAARREAGLRRSTTDVFADYVRIVFDSAATFGRAAERYLANPAERGALAEAMRQAVQQGFSYQQRMREMLELLRSGYTSAAAG